MMSESGGVEIEILGVDKDREKVLEEGEVKIERRVNIGMGGGEI